jgi:sigma-54 dependent transcriptional regulator, acetoin dehydrogenase operon transcriptional activator AcoR
MRVPSSSLSTSSSRRLPRSSTEPKRPIAAALQLPSEHTHAIDESHARCATLGLSHFEEPDLTPLGRADLVIARERNRRLHAHACPVMEMLFEQIAQTQSMVVLCDATGTVIHSVGDDDFLSRARKVALAPGANWSEQTKGTNAIGTALVAEAPTLVHADEHFMHANHFLTCSAAPILDPRGNMLGVLDVTGDRHTYHQHTMALVRMSARMIENQWLSDDYRHVIRLHLHRRAEFIGTLMEGILAVSPDGRIVGANRSALDQLDMSSATARMHTLPSLLGTSVGALVEHFRAPRAAPLMARTADERLLYLTARFDGPTWHRPADAQQAPPPTRAAALANDSADDGALAALTAGDAQMADIVAKVRRVIDRDIPILILGETGTGKELLARAIHQASQRARLPFVCVDCASIDLSRVEPEQFAGGTLFLDEIGDMPLAQQALLLRALQRPRGAAIVCATQRNLRDMIATQTFREDLYYQLNGLTVRLPPLRERSDLAPLAARIVAREAPQPMALSADVTALLARCSWPGNVRQLFNVLRTACAMALGERVLKREHLSDDFLAELASDITAAAPAPTPAGPPAAVAASAPQTARSLDDIEIDAIRSAVEAARGNISKAAKRLGISRNTIYRKLRWNR